MAEQTEGSIHIAASPAEVMAVIDDYGSYPQWANGVKRTEVRKRDSRGRPSSVFFEVGQMGIGASYTLSYSYAPDDGGVTWVSDEASGAVKEITGEYVLEPTDGGTDVTYRTAVELGISVPAIVRRQAERMIISTALEGLKGRVEGRVG